MVIHQFNEITQAWRRCMGCMFWQVSLIVIICVIPVFAISQTSESETKQQIQDDNSVSPKKILLEGLIVKVDIDRQFKLEVKWSDQQPGVPIEYNKGPSFTSIPNGILIDGEYFSNLRELGSRMNTKIGVNILSTPSISLADGEDGKIRLIVEEEGLDLLLKIASRLYKDNKIKQDIILLDNSSLIGSGFLQYSAVNEEGSILLIDLLNSKGDKRIYIFLKSHITKQKEKQGE